VAVGAAAGKHRGTELPGRADGDAVDVPPGAGPCRLPVPARPGDGAAPAPAAACCATHYYEAGTSLWEVQRILGHEWATTTVRYILTAQGDPERASLEAAGRARQRLAVDTGRLL
jgi:hypothetical protein